jgi:hypothetical protein
MLVYKGSRVGVNIAGDQRGFRHHFAQMARHAAVASCEFKDPRSGDRRLDKRSEFDGAVGAVRKIIIDCSGLDRKDGKIE